MLNILHNINLMKKIKRIMKFQNNKINNFKMILMMNFKNNKHG